MARNRKDRKSDRRGNEDARATESDDASAYEDCTAPYQAGAVRTVSAMSGALSAKVSAVK